MKMQGPYRFEMKVAVVADNGDRGEVTLELGEPGNPPTAEQIQALLDAAEEAAVQMFEGRLMNKAEFFNFLMSEKTGSDQQWSTPGSIEWDKI